jgi:hypothetical protein
VMQIEEELSDKNVKLIRNALSNHFLFKDKIDAIM